MSGGNRQYPMHCKYDEGHGEFANGLTLRKHYDEAHAGEYVAKVHPRVTCDVCGTEMSRASFYSHRTSFHGDDRSVTFTYAVVAERIVRSPSASGRRGNCTLCDTSIMRDGMGKHLRNRHGIHAGHGQVASYWRAAGSSNVVEMHPVEQPQQLSMAHHPSVQQQEQPQVDLEPLTADSIVIGAIEAMAYPGNSVPVASMAALFLWRDQTAAMIAAVTGQAQ